MRVSGLGATMMLAVAVFGPPFVQTPGPPPQATFRSSVDVVEVDVSVLDRNRLPVRGLTAGDFTVLEDGKPRQIIGFTEVELPRRETPTAPWLDLVAPDVDSNALATEGRLVVILMDRSITVENRPTALEIARTAIEQMRPGDLGAVLFSSLGVPQNFTSDRRLLHAAIEQPLLRLPSGDGGGQVNCPCGSCSLETIVNVAEGLRDVPQRRKVLIVIGPNISVNPMGNCAGSLSNVRTRAVHALQAANVTVHAFDPAGLETLSGSAAQAGPPNYQALAAASMRRRGNLAFLPGETGGRVVGGNEPALDVSRVFRESDSYYLLGFERASGAPDGRFHRISVKVSRPDTLLQARRGYFAPGARVERNARLPRRIAPSLGLAVAGVWPKTDLDLTMQTVALARSGLRDADVQVTLAVLQNARPRRPGMPPAPRVDVPLDIEPTIFVGAFDREGRSLADTQGTPRVRVQPRADGAFHYEITSQLTLKPGRYEIRAAVDDRTIGASGSVYGYVEVPDFAGEAVTLSGIFLQAGSPTTATSMPTAESLPIVPTARRTFAPSERVTAFVREHQGLTRAMMPGYLTVEIKNQADVRVFGQEQRILPQAFGSNRAMDYAFDLPLRDLPSGEYLLTVEARHGNIVVSRTARFRVE
jgi:VWFA-related protein